MTGMCLKDSHESSYGAVDPCLKPKGHKSKHEHKRLCTSPNCSCGNFDAHMTTKEWMKLEDVRQKTKELRAIEDKIVEKVNKRILRSNV